MEGGYIYLDNYNLSTLLLYKELKNNVIFYVKYNFIEFNINYINIYDFFKIFPNNSIHIISTLPYYDYIELTLDVWKNIALNRLNFLNKFK